MAEPALQRCPPLDGLDDCRIEPDPGVKAEEPPIDAAEGDGAQVAGIDSVGEQFDGCDRVVGKADRSCEHVRRSTRQDAKGGLGAGDARRHLVERAVAAEADHDVDAPPRRVVGEARCVPPPVRLDDLDVVAAAQPTLDHHGVPRRHRGRKRVDDEQDAQAPQATRPRASDRSARSPVHAVGCRAARMTSGTSVQMPSIPHATELGGTLRVVACPRVDPESGGVTLLDEAAVDRRDPRMDRGVPGRGDRGDVGIVHRVHREQRGGDCRVQLPAVIDRFDAEGRNDPVLW